MTLVHRDTSLNELDKKIRPQDMILGQLEASLVPMDVTFSQDAAALRQMETSHGQMDATLCILNISLDRNETTVVQKKKRLVQRDAAPDSLDKPHC